MSIDKNKENSQFILQYLQLSVVFYNSNMLRFGRLLHFRSFDHEFSHLVSLTFFKSFFLIKLNQSPTKQTSLCHTYFHPISESHETQNKSRTVCSPVIKFRSSFSPTVTLTLRKHQFRIKKEEQLLLSPSRE